jgi:parallel beta-helix repeat protein
MIMKKITLSLIAACGLVLAAASDGRALARAFVSINGNDNNACSQMAPCRTLTGAMANVLAGGEVVMVDSGLFGNVEIDKAVTIMGAPGVHAGVGFDTKAGTAVTIRAPAGAVIVLRNLYITTRSLNQLYRGVNFLSGGALHIENCVIDGFKLYGVSFNPDNLTCDANCLKLSVKDSFVRNNGIGISFRSAIAVIEHSRIESNATGVQIYGAAEATLRDSIVSTNSEYGITVGYTSNTRVELCSLTNNGTGLFMLSAETGAGTAYVSDTLISGNNVGLKFQNGDPGKIYSFGNNRLIANTTDGNFTQILLTQ